MANSRPDSKDTEPTPEQNALAAYIVTFLIERNGEQLREAFDTMTVRDHRLLHEELAWILKHGGHPPNWVR